MKLLEPASPVRRDEFLDAVRKSRGLHRDWVSPPRSRPAFEEYLARLTDSSTHLGYFVCTESGDLAGVVNVNEIVRGAFSSAYLGYYAFVPYNGRGYLSRGLTQVVTECFGAHRLHRLEANIQPENTASRRLVERLGFRLEGFSPRYLHIAGAWRDHQRWAITTEEWTPRDRTG